MADSARVHSIDALDQLRNSLTDFGQRGIAALDLITAEIRRTEEWLQEQLSRWQIEMRRCEEEVFLAKQDLARRRMMRFNDKVPDTSEQEKALRKAQAKLDYAQEKAETTRRWLRDLNNELIEYEGPTRILKNMLESDVPRACALLKNKIESLEAYLSVTPSEPFSSARSGSPSTSPTEGKKP